MAIKEHRYTASLGGSTRVEMTVQGQPLNEISVPGADGGEPKVWKLVDVTNWPTAHYELDTMPATVASDLAQAGALKPRASHVKDAQDADDGKVPEFSVPEISDADLAELSADGLPDESDPVEKPDA